MYKMTVTIKNPSGLHARPASTFIKLPENINPKSKLPELTTLKMQ